MELLINKAKVSEILQVAIGYNENEFNVFIREAQDFDLKPLLCEKFYFELLNKKDEGVWKELLDGKSYVFEENNYYTRGLADVLAYFAYARFYRKSNNVSTSHGLVNKTSPHSTPLTTDEKNIMYRNYRKDAHTIFNDLERFVERNISNYMNWSECEESCDTQKVKQYKTMILK